MNNNFSTDSVSQIKRRFVTPLAPKSGIKDFWRDFVLHKKYLLICFALPALLTLLMYFCFQVYPIGEASVLVLDLNGQYVYFFEGLRDIITEGGTLLYSFSRALGGEFIGLFAYYLSSPFSFIVALFPKESITDDFKYYLDLLEGKTSSDYKLEYTINPRWAELIMEKPQKTALDCYLLGINLYANDKVSKATEWIKMSIKTEPTYYALAALALISSAAPTAIPISNPVTPIRMPNCRRPAIISAPGGIRKR